MDNPRVGEIFLNGKCEAKLCFQKVQKLVRCNLRTRASKTLQRDELRL